MKPYGRTKILKANFIDNHIHKMRDEKGRKLVNWWEVICDYDKKRERRNGKIYIMEQLDA